MKNISVDRTGSKNAQAALADINAKIQALNQQRVALAQPLKDRYAEMRAELVALDAEVRQLDPEWKPQPMKPKAETKIAEVLTAKGKPLTADEIIAAVGDAFTSWKIKNVLKKKSTGAKAVFALADGKYGMKAAA
ncbi:MAG TPA: hypothetical protein PKI20_02460 [Verrucomicrobiota bacterium]|jgi:hypothetical protein|nr:hypothetical protein [Verrucomicrobiota bacterium]HQL76663.1 hypothetical protein [Verrucomicrobiota bacterium]